MIINLNIEIAGGLFVGKRCRIFLRKATPDMLTNVDLGGRRVFVITSKE